MERKTIVLAETAGLGRVYDCGECGNLHVTVGPVTITMEPQAYLQFVTMMHTSAANFETWMAERQSGETHVERQDHTDQA